MEQEEGGIGMRSDQELRVEIFRLKELMEKEGYSRADHNVRYWALRWVLGEE